MPHNPDRIGKIPNPHPRLPGISIVCGAVLLFWFSTENASMPVVTVLGIMLAFILLLLGITHHFGGRELSVSGWLITAGLVGGLLGVGSAICTAGLMIFKNAWHAHAYPDFPADMVVGVIIRLPVRGLAGMLIGLSAGLGTLLRAKAW